MRPRLNALAQRHPDLSIAAALLLGAAALMSPYLSRTDAIMWPRSGLGTDFLHYRWSHVYYLQRSLAEYGELPLWHRTVLGGEPLIGNPSVMLFYPPHLLFALSPLPILWAFALQTTLHLWIAGLGTYMLARRTIGLGRLAAGIGAFAYLFAPRLSSNAVGDLGLTYAMCWTPFCLAWARQALEQKRLAYVCLAGLGLAFQLLIHVHIFFYTVWAIGLYFLYRTALQTAQGLGGWPVRRLGQEWLRAGGRLALIGLACAGLAAFHLLPFATYLPHLSRQSLSLAEANYFALPPAMLVSAIMPLALKFPEWEMYTGLLPLVLAPMAALSGRRAEIGWWAGLALFSILFSLGQATPLFPLLFQWVPGFAWLRVPARMLFFLPLATAMLAGLAVEAVVSPGSQADWRPVWRNWLAPASFLLITATIAGRWFTRRPGEADWALGLLGSLGLLAGLAAIWGRTHGRLGRAACGGLLLGGLLLDLMPVDAAYMTPRSAAIAFQMPAAGRLLQSQVTAERPFRIYAIQHEIPEHLLEQAGWEAAHGINSFQFETAVEFMKQASGCDLPGFAASVPPCLTNEVSSTAYRQARPNAALLGLLNVRYVISPLELKGSEWTLVGEAEGERVYENALILPRAFGVGRVERVANQAALWLRLAAADARYTAFVTDAGRDFPLPDNDFYAPADSLEYRPNQIRVNITMPEAGLLILSEIWTPGWQQTGESAHPEEVWRVNGTLRGIPLDAGVHQITLRFWPRSFALGLLITGATLLACVFTWVRERNPQ